MLELPGHKAQRLTLIPLADQSYSYELVAEKSARPGKRPRGPKQPKAGDPNSQTDGGADGAKDDEDFVAVPESLLNGQ